jgi:hypothetical protein
MESPSVPRVNCSKGGRAQRSMLYRHESLLRGTNAWILSDLDVVSSI